MNKRLIKIFLAVAAILIIAWLGYMKFGQDNKPDTAGKVGNSPAANSAESSPEKPTVEEGGELPHPVSLPALMQKKFDGRDFQLGRVLEENSAYTRYYITYKSGSLTISGIMNVPKGAGPFPVLVLNHGYIDPAVYTNGRGLKREQDYLARRGYAVLHPDYRNHAQSDKDPNADVNFRLGYVEDVINAVYALKSSGMASLDTGKIGMLGHSMGGGVTLNILVIQPDLVNAAVLFAPVSGDYRDNFERWTVSRPETAQKIVEQYGRPEDSPEFWDNISANTFLEKVSSPVLLHHGTADESVPIEWSDRLAKLMKENNKNIDYRVYPGQPHEFTSAWTEVMQTTLEFFNRNLK